MIDLLVSFSGGRTSAYMSKWLLDNMGHIFNFHFLFANTGQEHEETLKFVNMCDREFGLNLIWLEAVINLKKGEGTSYQTTSFANADRTGKTFEQMIKKYGVPNKDYPHCTRELKLQPMRKWAKDHGFENSDFALGIRSDEPVRYKPKKGVFYPLVQLHPVDKKHILGWWKNQKFNLHLPEHLGNCTWCWKKSDRKLATLMDEYPNIFKFPFDMETKYGDIITNPDIGDRRVFFRNYRSTAMLVLESEDPFNRFIDPDYETCAEECGSVFPE